ncbi:MAG: ABC transporter permease [Actinobacteria bacterium]|nr:ABC transporter permease [Actinomycetota bacterium]
MTAAVGTMRLVSASTKQILRSSEVWATTFAFPGALLAIVWLFSRIRFEFGQQEASLIDLWVTGLGLLGVALGNTHAFLSTIATYKAEGVLKRISVTPVTPGQLIVGEVIPRATLGMLTLIVFLAAGNALGADIRMGAELMAVLPVMVMVTFTGLSVAFIIAGVTRNPQNANALDTAANWPLYLLTGAAYPLAAFPTWLEELARYIPYTGLIATVRGTLLDGRPLTDFGSELAIGAVWIGVLLVGAARAYRFVK